MKTMNRQHLIDSHWLQTQREQSWLTFADLDEIITQYEQALPWLQKTLQNVVNSIRTIPFIKSVKMRHKSPERLIIKIIKKWISPSSFITDVKDLVGVRILYLVDADRSSINEQLEKLFGEAIIEKKIFINDSFEIHKKQQFEQKWFALRDATGWYVWHQHYIIKQGDHFCEIQVRSLFSEAWCELDHYVSYSTSHTDPTTEWLLVAFKSLMDGAEQIAEKIIHTKNNITQHHMEKQYLYKQLLNTHGELKREKQKNVPAIHLKLNMPNTSDPHYNMNDIEDQVKQYKVTIEPNLSDEEQGNNGNT